MEIFYFRENMFFFKLQTSMKNSLLKFSFAILAILSLTFFTSCGNDDDPEMVSIEGTWDYDEFDLEISINNMSDVDFFIQEFGATPAQATAASQSLKDGFFESDDFEGTRFIFASNGSYEIRVDDQLDESGTYLVNADNTILTLSSDSESIDFEIAELSRNRLTISVEERFEIDLTDDDIDEVLELKIIISFIR